MIINSTVFIIAFLVYISLVFVLPPEKAKYLKPIGKILKYIANTPGGLKIK
jgi:hypothetical protein